MGPTASSFIELSPMRVVKIDNVSCAYCGSASEQLTNEHVVGRRFVPKGTLQSSWNLILKACASCNCRKSDLEDDISAITLGLNDELRSTQSTDPSASFVERKIVGAKSRRTGKSVAESDEEINLNFDLGSGFRLKFNLSSPPQIDSDRAFELARLQLTAFFYWQTFDKQTRRGGYWLGGFFPVLAAAKSDWGNQVFLWFTNTVASWETRLKLHTGEEYFRAATWKHPTEDCWAWAIEWNKTYRVIGFFGNKEAVMEAAADIPNLDVHEMLSKCGVRIATRSESKLEAENDSLFD